jgi:hypothetical protein
MKAAAKKKPTTYTLNGHRAFYLREENTIPVAKEREQGKVRVLTVVHLFLRSQFARLSFARTLC